MWILPAHVPNRFKSARGFLQEVPEDGTNLRNGSKKSFFPTKHPLAAFAVLFLLVAQTSSGLGTRCIGTRLIGTTFICAEMSEMFARAKYKLLWCFDRNFRKTRKAACGQFLSSLSMQKPTNATSGTVDTLVQILQICVVLFYHYSFFWCDCRSIRGRIVNVYGGFGFLKKLGDADGQDIFFRAADVIGSKATSTTSWRCTAMHTIISRSSAYWLLPVRPVTDVSWDFEDWTCFESQPHW